MSVRKIEPSDTLQAGFRAKYNETILELITGWEWLTPATAGVAHTGDVLRLKKFGGGFIDIPLSDYYATKAELGSAITAATGIPYKGAWSGVDYSTTVLVDNNGVLYRNTAPAASTDEPGVTTPSIWVAVTQKGYSPPDPQESIQQGPGVIMVDIPTGFTKYDARIFKDDSDAGVYYYADVTYDRVRLDYGGINNTQVGVRSDGEALTVRFSK